MSLSPSTGFVEKIVGASGFTSVLVLLSQPINNPASKTE
jgi:hypothetical protein